MFEVIILSKKKGIVKLSNFRNFNIGVVIFFIIIIYVLFNIFSYFTKTHIAEYQVQQGTIASNNIYQGIIVRDETVEYATKVGYINYYKKNASKVSVNDVIYSVDTTGKISKQIEASATNTNALSSDTLSSISSEIDSFISDYNSSKFSESYKFYNNLNTEIAQSVNLNALADLSSAVIDAQGKNTFFQYTSPEDGIIVYEIDGYENYTIEDIISSEFTYNNYKETHLFSQNTVNVGDPVYKRVNSEYWNIIIPISESLARDLADKTAVRVRFCKDNFELDTACSLMKNNEQYYLNLSFNKGMIRYVNDRFIDVELVMSEKTGLKIPQSAITSKEFFTIPKKCFTQNEEKSNQTGLLIKTTQNGTETINLISPTVYYETDDYYYVDSEVVSEGDIVIMPNSSSTYIIGTDKDSLIGVYNINKGYAVFKQINIIYENEDYAIVETKTTYGIALYDHIALNADEIKENQLTTK